MIVNELRSPHRGPRGIRSRRSLALAGTLLTTLVLSSCAKDAELDTFQPRGPSAKDIDTLIRPVFYVAGIVLLFVFGATAYMIKKFGVKEYAEADFPDQVHGNTKLEIGWTIAPAAILAVVAVFTVATLQKLNDYDRDEGMSVVVVGQQWWWEYRYYEDGFNPAKDFDPGIDIRLDEVQNHKGKTEKIATIVTATQLVMPVDKEVDLYITSRDVIHSHWIPALNGKRDAVPGRIQPWKVEAAEPGVFFGQCTEFCGLSHSRMRMQVVALSDADFKTWWDQQKAPATAPTPASQKWLDQQKAITAKTVDLKANPNAEIATPTATAAERGMVIFRGQCTSCHLATGINEDIYGLDAEGNFIGSAQVSKAAPDLTHFASRTTYAGGIFNLYNPNGTVNRPQLEAWLRNPPKEKDAYAVGQRGMPNLNLSEDQINDLVEYLLTLGEKPSEAVIAATEVEG
jgi:cytochrome c oxidase subunit 2